MKKFILGSFLCLAATVNAQNKITGRVIDAITSEPIPFASVFLANTSVGVSTNQHGLFVIDKFPDGKYVLTVTHIGYQTFQISLDFDNEDEFNNEVSLVPSSITLPQIEVNEDTTGRKDNLIIFKNLVIGSSGNAEFCTLLNPEMVHLYHDSETGNLYAHSKEPLIIENNALGYRVIYKIETFNYNPHRGRVYTFGIPRFEFLEPQNEAEENKWIRNRQEVYMGSVMHFIRALYQDQLTQNGFELMKLDSSNNKKYDFTDSLHVKKMEIADSRVMNIIAYKGTLIIKFNRKQMKKTNGVKIKGNKKFESTMSFLADSISIYSNGEYENIKNVLYEGHWAHAETISNWLPYDYFPESGK
jgi:hypothetical protein